jgi:hypothetical protein
MLMYIFLVVVVIKEEIIKGRQEKRVKRREVVLVLLRINIRINQDKNERKVMCGRKREGVEIKRGRKSTR